MCWSSTASSEVRGQQNVDAPSSVPVACRSFALDSS
jgi:hypothetical protein